MLTTLYAKRLEVCCGLAGAEANVVFHVGTWKQCSKRSKFGPAGAQQQAMCSRSRFNIALQSWISGKVQSSSLQGTQEHIYRAGVSGSTEDQGQLLDTTRDWWSQ
jgi:hypothetical protein